MGVQQTLRERIADALREAIINGDLPPGGRLQEIEIAESYKTSRTPVREAFRQLESEGFLVLRPRRGAVVAPITERDIREFYELKSLLEGYAARKAVTRLSDDEINRMESLNGELRKLYERSDVSGMVPVHNEFHEIFVRASGNERLSSLIKTLVQQFQRFRIALSHTDAVEDSIKLHDKIVEAFRMRDADLASSLVAENSTQGSDALVNRLQRIETRDRTGKPVGESPVEARVM